MVTTNPKILNQQRPYFSLTLHASTCWQRASFRDPGLQGSILITCNKHQCSRGKNDLQAFCIGNWKWHLSFQLSHRVYFRHLLIFPGGSDSKESACKAGDPGSISLGRKDSLEKGTETHAIILVWRIPWTEEPDSLQSMGSPRVGHDWATNTFTLSLDLETT